MKRRILLWLLGAATEAGKVVFGMLIASLIVSALINKECRAQVPANAGHYKHQLRQQAHMVWGLDAPISTFAAQIHQESHWNATARSRVGAVGLSQFMPSTADWISGAYPNLRENAPMNPTWAMRALVTYNKHLYTRIAAENKCERMAFVLSAYNGGLGWVIKRKAKSAVPLQCLGKTCDINPGIAPANQKENAEYPRRILLRYEPTYVKAGWGAGSCS